MKKVTISCLVAAALAVAAFQLDIGTKPVLAAAPTFTVIPISASSAAPIPTVGTGGDATQDPEVDLSTLGGDVDGGAGDGFAGINRTIAAAGGTGPRATGRTRAKSNPKLVASFEGLNFNNQRFANHGNQFSVEPPDQGLCAGNGFVLESANDVLRVHDANGGALTGVVDLNSFYGYAPAINRQVSPLQFGPSVTDPSCYFDTDTQRWFHVVLTLDRARPTTQALSGANHLDIAVSTTSDPTGSWVVYRLPVQNDGTQGTPDHHCIVGGPTSTVHGPCLGDYPHIGADANGFYITTNEFDLAGPFFHGAQIYALSKHQLAANAPAVNAVLFDTTNPALGVQLDGTPGFTVWPAQSPTAADFQSDTEFFLSSEAVFQDTGVDSRLRVWSITNTSSLDTATPAPVLSARVAAVTPYAVPGSSTQKAGSIPLAQCIGDPACAPLVGVAPTATQTNVESRIPSNDSRMQQVFLANGKLWGALDTGLLINGTDQQAGIAYFVLNPNSLHVFAQGYVGFENNNAIYPAVAVNSSGRGVMAFTLVGSDHYPSAGYVSLDAKIGAGDLHVAAEGAGPQDGFSGYAPLSQNSRTRIRPRWGDYGAAVADGDNFWIASEYIAQTCTYTDYKAAPFGTCGGTRASLGNWSTRVTKLIQ
jgi:hypothetical protein